MLSYVQKSSVENYDDVFLSCEKHQRGHRCYFCVINQNDCVSRDNENMQGDLFLFSETQNTPQVESWSLAAQTQTTTQETLIIWTPGKQANGKLP